MFLKENYEKLWPISVFPVGDYFKDDPTYFTQDGLHARHISTTFGYQQALDNNFNDFNVTQVGSYTLPVRFLKGALYENTSYLGCSAFRNDHMVLLYRGCYMVHILRMPRRDANSR